MQLLQINLISDEFKKLSAEGLGMYVHKDRMAKDLVLPTRNYFCAFVKKEFRALDKSFFQFVQDKECKADLYTLNYDKPIDGSSMKVAMKYSTNKDLLMIKPCETDTESKDLELIQLKIHYTNSVVQVIHNNSLRYW